MLEFLAEGSGPLGVEPTYILRARAFDIARFSVMHDRRARSTIKSGFPMAFSGPLDRADSRVCPYRCCHLSIENRIRAMCVFGSQTDGEKGDRRSRPTLARMTITRPSALCGIVCHKIGMGPRAAPSRLEFLAEGPGIPRLAGWPSRPPHKKRVPDGLLGAPICDALFGQGEPCPCRGVVG